MARRKRIWKVSPVAIMGISVIISFCILWMARGTKPINSQYNKKVPSGTIKGSLFGRIVEKVTGDPKKDYSDEISDQFKRLKNGVDKKSGDYGLYIKDLDNDNLYLINQDETFYTASLFKIPIAVAVLKQIDDKKITYEQEITYLGQDFYGGTGTIQTTPIGSNYTIKYLLDVLMKQSDNIAQNMLTRVVGEKAVGEAIKSNLKNEKSKYFSESIASVNDIGDFLENVKESSYLSKESKEYLIEIMSETSFDDRISEHLNVGLSFAHKIGNWGDEGTWHDCGIIFGENNMVVCVMSKNTTYNEFLDVCKETAEFLNFYSTL